ncbi:MAG: ssDNA endodeoxyribonuclease [Piccolia ochrophora]|nr:MAG: ssDNA endodeoxyribonuclease [Piccolia ochrophora]
MSPNHRHERPIFSAVSSSARQLFQILRCVGFAAKAQVSITSDGLRFAVEESRVMQGLAFLDKALFTTYHYDSGISLDPEEPPSSDQDDDPPSASFQISLPALLETLQIFGADPSKDRWSRDAGSYSSGVGGGNFRNASAFDSRTLGMMGICRLSYASPGSPLCIIIEEAGVTTTCELVTYAAEMSEEIPLQRDKLCQKIIMRASWLHDAIAELSSTNPTRLTITASPVAPYFLLAAAGPLGSATVEFSKDPQLLETFQVPRRTVNTYKYALVRAAARAMAIASKVSIRGDEQGVLSLQFMIEVQGGGISFVDFRFVPYLPEEGEGDEDEDG